MQEVSSVRQASIHQERYDRFTRWLTEALDCLRTQSFEPCHGYLDSALEDLLADPTPERIEPFFSCLNRFHDSLLGTAQHTDAMKWIWEHSEGLLGKILRHLKRHSIPPLARQTFQMYSAAAESLPKGTDATALRLKIDVADRAWQASIHAEIFDPALQTMRGDLYLELCAFLLPEECYDSAIQPAAIAYHSALHREPSNSALQAKLTELEKVYLHKVLPSLRPAMDHFKNKLWEGARPIELVIAQEQMEILAEYGAPDLASLLCRECILYSKRFHPEAKSSLETRYGEIRRTLRANPSWQINRQVLQSIRGITAHLFHEYLGGPVSPMPSLPPLLEHHAQRCLAEVEGRPLSIHGIQDIHSQLITHFVEHLFSQATAFFEKPPCDFTLVGLGSLARGEMSIYSDLDAIILVEKKTPEVVSYFTKVACYFELLILNLGETKLTPNMADGFSLDLRELHPRRTIETPEAILKRQGAELASVAHQDLDPIALALRQPCRITGSEALFQDYLDRLRGWQAEHGEKLGTLLLQKWANVLRKEGPTFDVKDDLYRPITLLIDAYRNQHKIPSVKTTEQLTALRPFLPAPYLDLLCRALELACRLRTRAHIHYGEEKETVHLTYDPTIKRPLHISYSDFVTLLNTRELLFHEAKPVEVVQSLAQQEQMNRVNALSYWGLPSTDRALVALWQGRFDEAKALAPQKEDELGLSQPSLFDQAYAEHQRILETTGPSPSLSKLAGRLHALRIRGGKRTKIPKPSAAIFAPSVLLRTRQELLSQYLMGLTMCSIPERLKPTLWTYVLQPPNHLVQSCEALYSALTELDINAPTELDLRYSDLLSDLRTLLVQHQTKDLVTYLFHLFPKAAQPRFLDELDRAGIDTEIIASLRRFPCRDGMRPLWIDQVPNWKERFSPLCDFSSCPVGLIEGLTSPPMPLSQEASTFLADLMVNKKTLHGRRHCGSFEGFHIKLMPELAGREQAVCSLNRMITGRFYPARELVRLDLGDVTLPASISETVPGPNLLDLISKSPDKNPECLRRLDHRQFSETVLMTLITSPEDDSPDNFVAHEPVPGGPVQIVNVDPDRVFFDSSIETGFLMFKKKKAQLKSIILCLDQMRLPINSDLLDEFLTLDPVQLLQNWLKDMNLIGERTLQMFGRELLDSWMNEKLPSQLLLFPEPSTYRSDNGTIQKKGLVLTLLTRMQNLQRQLKRFPRQPLIDLFIELEPEIGKRYQEQLNKKISAFERFRAVTDNANQCTSAQSLILTSTPLHQPFKSVDAYASAGWTIERAIKDFSKVTRSFSFLATLVKDLIQGDGTQLHRLGLAEPAEATLSQIDFAKYPPASQKLLLLKLVGLPFRKLRLPNCYALDVDILTKILSHCPDLTLLDLRRCTGLTTLPALVTLCPHLTKLSLHGCSNIDTLSLNLPHLRWLDVGQCPYLEAFSLIAPQLELLAWTGKCYVPKPILECENLQTIVADDESTQEWLLTYRPAVMLLDKTEIVFEPIHPSTLRGIKSMTQCGSFLVYQTNENPIPTHYHQLLERLRIDSAVIKTPTGKGKLKNYAVRLEQSGIDIESIIELSRHNDLGVLDLSMCDQELRSHHIATLFANCPSLHKLTLSKELPLQSLSLRGHPSLIDSHLAALTQPLAQLQALDVSRCNMITNVGVTSVVNSLPALTSLNISHCDKLSAEVLKKNHRFRKLKVLGIAGFPWLTQELVTKATDAKKTEYVDLSDSPSLLAFIEPHSTPWFLSLPGALPVTQNQDQRRPLAVLSGCTNITALEVSTRNLTNNTLPQLSDYCRNLTALEVWRPKDAEEYNASRLLSSIAKRLPKLTNLAVRCFPNITGEDARVLATDLPKLKTLALSDSSSLTGHTVASIITLSGQLTSLQLGGSEGDRLFEFHLFSDPANWGFIQSTNPKEESKPIPDQLAPSLELINWKLLTDSGLLELLKACPNLSALAIGDCASLSENGLIAVGKFAHSLQVLCVVSSQFTNAAWIEVTKGCQNLKQVWLERCPNLHGPSKPCKTGRLLKTPRSQLLQLKYLFIQECESFSDEGFRNLVSYCPNLRQLSFDDPKKLSHQTVVTLEKSLPKLSAQYLWLLADCKVRSSSFQIWAKHSYGSSAGRDSMAPVVDWEFAPYEFPEDLTPKLLCALLKRTPLLRVLNLSGCAHFSLRGLVTLLKSSPNIEALNLEGWDQLDNAGLAKLAKHSPQFKGLTLGGNTKITDQGLSMLAGSCRQLDYFELNEMNNLTDQGIGAIVSAAPSLRVLRLCHNPLLTGHFIETIGSTCQELEILEIQQDEPLEARTLEALAIGCPKLKRLRLPKANSSRQTAQLLRKGFPKRVINFGARKSDCTIL